MGASWKRTHDCGELRAAHAGATVVLNGWVNKRRDHGGIYFLDLRDRYGITQIVLPQKVAGDVKLGPEYVLSVRGKVTLRDGANINRERPTGEIEIAVEHVEVLSSSPVPPFPIEDEIDTALDLRLRYRYLDLRRGSLQRNLIHRSKFIQAMRRAFEREGFLDIETPILTKATPEGARDYLVPSRVHPGEFYALPQSPQIFKQLLMVSGLDKYFQVARCFRDEDLRADRQPEFTQLDMEMSFVDEEDIFGTWERVLQATMREACGVELESPFPRMTWDESMERFGVDKPDLRFGLELRDAKSWAADCEFQVFRNALAAGGRVMGITVPAALALSRKDITTLEDGAKALGAKGLAWWKAEKAGGAGPLAKFCVAPGSAERLMALMSASDGDTILFVADREAVVRKVLGDLRNQLGRKFSLAQSGTWKFTWVTSFPLFEWDEDSKRWFSAHHPFTAPVDWDLGGANADFAKLSSRAYDLVLNGWELGSGSVRIHRADVQQRIFEILGIGPEERQRKFGFLLEALSFGAPPHAGFALGLDRTSALTLGLDNIRDVIAFPKTASAADLMCGAPSQVAPEQLAEVHVRTAVEAQVAPEPKA
ncbi:MAG: aspartate--tRNA ligase [Planctomycetes bacterium]|nr:aspartate--tRNA ligase [Planctomycetota bacterium]